MRKFKLIIGYNVRTDQNLYIASIKAVRQLTGWGLKEAKDAVDIMRDRGEEYKLLVSDRAMSDFFMYGYYHHIEIVEVKSIMPDGYIDCTKGL